MNRQNLITLAIETTATLWASYGRQIAEVLAKEAASKLSLWAKIRSKRAASSIWDKVNWQLAASRYYSRLGDLHGTTTILGMAKPIPLEGIFTDVYILDTPTAFRRYDIDQLTQDPRMIEQQNIRTDALTLVKQKGNNRLFILGKPGAGKTTFLKHLVGEAILGQITQRRLGSDGSEGKEGKT